MPLVSSTLFRNADSNITYILMDFDLSILMREREFSYVARMQFLVLSVGIKISVEQPSHSLAL
jgi:hypothetical protein